MKNIGTLDVSLPTDTDILLTRIFDAPRHLVWRCITEPALMKQWYGPRGHEVVLCEADVRVGGAWRNVSRTPSGKTVGFRGIYKEITPTGRLVSTESFDDFPGDSLVTITLTEQRDKTTFNLLASYPSKMVRDIVLASGMEHGAAESYDKLNELVVTLLWIDTPSLVRMERVVHAPRHHVYIAWRRPERMARWWAAEHVGGTSVRGIDGSHRVGAVVVKVLEDVPLERLVFLWGDGDDTATLVTVTFHDRDGGTRIAIDQTLAPRRERALLGGLDRLAVLLRAGVVG